MALFDAGTSGVTGAGFVIPCYSFCSSQYYTFQNKGSLLASMVLMNNLHVNIHVTFHLQKRFFKMRTFRELFSERFFGEPKMVLLWHHCKNTLLNLNFLNNVLVTVQ